ncbi:hypothetical protein [Streptomyces mutomycini]|uniref:hypothetical protein n=1 Tax=Streptomyces mutomycini TaxID=284036 RepID=UPI0033FE48F5
MFNVGDRVEVVVQDDPLFGYIGKVKEIFIGGNFRNIGVDLEEDTGEGLGRLWFLSYELRKVEQA